MKLNRISLNTIGLNRIGLNRIGSPSRGFSSGSGHPYIDPEVLASLVAVCICDGKTNYDPDRNIIKNKLPGRGGDFEILNAAYKLNSGFGKYEVDFTDKAIWSSSSKVTKVDSFSFQFNSTSPLLLHVYYSDISKDIPSFKIKVENDKELFYYYIDSNGNRTNITMQGSGEYTIPYSHVTLYTGDRLYLGFTGSGLGKVTQIPSFQGAFVTDGVDDTIVSQKTLSEMLGGSNKCTIVSLITHISGTGKYNIIGDGGIQVSDYSGQTFMAGASSKSGEKIVELGDKEKLKALQYTTFDSKLSIGLEDSSYAYYGTFIFNKDSVPIDWIHQVIAYFNLDKHVEPIVYYDIPKQGLTNETPHADWYLKDFSKNGWNMALFNYARTPESGINEEGGLQSDGVNDYGQLVQELGLKDYTIAVDRAYPSLKGNGVPIISSINGNTVSPFLFEFADNTGAVRPYSFGATTVLSPMELNRKISYQSTYIYDGTTIIKGIQSNAGSGLTIGRFGEDRQYANIALWSLLLFPYSLSEFLLERQLKKYKLGTLYPDMVELRPIVKSNMGYLRIEYRNGKGGLIKSGTYLPIGGILRVIVVLNNTVDEVSLKINGEVVPLKPEYSANGFWTFDYIITKSPQKIDITIDEYIRFEDIVQPYPAIVNIPKVDGGYYTYGDKIPVGYRFRRESAINLLPELYSLSDIFLNGELCNVGAEIVISKSMVFTANKAWLLDTTEPHAIYSPQKLNIPNSSLKILGYVPDLTGKGNHGKLNNFAYTEDSGVAADGSIKFDGTDDHITIPTLAHGGKCVMMKVNWTKAGMLYDQRLNSSSYLFGIYTSEGLPAYNARNNGSTYIDGILNTNIIPSDLVGITHNITVVNDKATDDNTISPILGASVTNATFSGMFLYEFMLFHEIPSEDEIKKLNDVMGIEGGYVESPDYYWDAYGKANSATLDIDYVALNQASDAHKRLIDKSRAGLAALELYHNTGIITELNNRTLKVNNFAFNEESGYGGWLGIGDLTKSFNESYVTNNWKRGGTFIKGKTSSGSSIGYALANWYDVTNPIFKK